MRVFPHENPEFVFVTSAHPKVRDWIMFSVKPTTHRYYDESIRAWAVHVDHLFDLVKIGTFHSGRVDYSELPMDAQMAIAAQKAAWRTGAKLGVEKVETSDPYRVMHLLPSAPPAIVDSVFKALAKIHHPDKGGDPEEMKKVNEAYERIKSRQNANKHGA